MSWFEQPGLILFTERYDDCVAFYRDLLELPVIVDKGYLIALEFGSGYLMIEAHGTAVGGEKRFDQNAVTIRFDVADVEASAGMLRGRGIAVEIHNWDSGVTGLFLDPDGNRCELFRRAAAT